MAGHDVNRHRAGHWTFQAILGLGRRRAGSGRIPLRTLGPVRAGREGGSERNHRLRRLAILYCGIGARLSVGPFWGERAAAVSRASNSRDADPLAAIVDFHDQLKKAGIELLIVPVPAKAAIYPERISKRIKAPVVGASPHLDPYHEQFYRVLGQRGVPVLDLTPVFLKQRQSPGADLYCKTDTHWSGRAVELVAQAIAKHVEDRPWSKELPKSRYETEPRGVEITGDLARMMDEANPTRETLTVTFVGTRRDGQLAPCRAGPRQPDPAHGRQPRARLPRPGSVRTRGRSAGSPRAAPRRPRRAGRHPRLGVHDDAHRTAPAS